MTDEKKFKFEGVEIKGIPAMLAPTLTKTLELRTLDVPPVCGRLNFKDGVFSFEGDADKSALLLLESMNEQFQDMKNRLAAYESNAKRPLGLVSGMVRELMIADSVPMSDAWGRLLDRLGEIDRQRERENDLNAVKRLNGWYEADMCQFCGSTSSLKAIAARGGLSCCPDRRMIKTLVPANYLEKHDDETEM